MNARWGAPAVGFEVALSHAPLSPVTRKELCPLWDGACVPAGVLCTHWPLGGDHVRCSHCTLRSARAAFLTRTGTYAVTGSHPEQTAGWRGRCPKVKSVAPSG